MDEKITKEKNDLKKHDIRRITVRTLAAAMVIGFSGSGATYTFFDVISFHPDSSFCLSFPLVMTTAAAFFILLAWLVTEIFLRCIGRSKNDGMTGCIVFNLAAATITCIFITAFIPQVTKASPSKFSISCRGFMCTRTAKWSEYLSGTYPDVSMADIYAEWLRSPPAGKAPARWKNELEEYLTVRSYRDRKDRERMPAEKDFVYVYCGAGFPVYSGCIVFYEKEGMHCDAGNSRNVIHGDRSRSVLPVGWHSVEAEIEKQNIERQRKEMPHQAVPPSSLRKR